MNKEKHFKWWSPMEIYHRYKEKKAKKRAYMKEVYKALYYLENFDKETSDNQKHYNML